MIFKKIRRRGFSKVIVAAIAASTVIAVSCNDEDSGINEEVSNFEIQETVLFTSEVTGDDFRTVIFRDFSLGATSYLWDFGDGGTSTEQNPTYLYDDNGIYPVTLTTFDAAGNIIDITDPPIQVAAQEPAMDEVDEGDEGDVDDGGSDDGGSDTMSGQFAFITDTFAGDTGELRLDLGSSNILPIGMLSVEVSKTISDGDASIILAGTGDGNTSNDNLITRLNLADGSNFSLRNEVVPDANFPAFINDETYTIQMTWDASDGINVFLTISINGELISTDPFASAGTAANISQGLRNVLITFGGNDPTFDSSEGLMVDNLRIYDTSSGMAELVIEEGFESYTVGNILNDPSNPGTNLTADEIAIIDPLSPYHRNSLQATIIESDGGSDDGGPDDGGSDDVVSDFGDQFAMVTDTGDDTGELRYNFPDQLEVGRLVVSVSKTISERGATVNLSGVGTNNTNGENALIEVDFSDGGNYEFSESGENQNIMDIPVVNDEFVEFTIEWDATGTDAPMVEVFIDGVSLTGAPFATEAGLNGRVDRNDPTLVADGVDNLLILFGQSVAEHPVNEGVLVDNIRLYDTSSGSDVLVFSDDFEDYEEGSSLAPDPDHAVVPGTPISVDTPYHNNTYQATVTAF